MGTTRLAAKVATDSQRTRRISDQQRMAQRLADELHNLMGDDAPSVLDLLDGLAMADLHLTACGLPSSRAYLAVVSA